MINFLIKNIETMLILLVIIVTMMWTTKIYQVQELVEIAVEHNITLPTKFHDTAEYIKRMKGN